MARVPLNSVALPEPVLDEILSAGSAYVLAPNSSTESTVYADSSGTTALTQPIDHVRTGLRGFVEPGSYKIERRGRYATVDLFGSESAPSSMNHHRDYSLGYCTLAGGFYAANTDNLALTSGTVIFSRLEPVRHSFTFNNFVIHVGQTESATETDQRIGLYTSDGTTMTRVAITAASTTLLETDDIRVASPLASSAEYTLVPGVTYWVAIISVATTAGTVVGLARTGIGAATETAAATEFPTPAYTLGSQTALDATEAISGMTASWNVPLVYLTYVAA